MEYLIWLLIAGFFIWRLSSRTKKENQIREEINSIPNLKLYAKEESVDFKGQKFNVINVYAEGWIRGDTDVKFTGKVSLSLIDKTPGSEGIILTSTEGYGEELFPHIYNQDFEMDIGPYTYWHPDTCIFSVPVDVLAFPYKGKRKIQAKVIYGTRQLKVSMCGVGDEDKHAYIGGAITEFDYTVNSIGYKEFEKNALDFEESAIKLAMFTAAVDGSLDQIELDVIKSWCQKRSFFIENEQDAEDKKKNLSTLIQRTYKLAKDRKLNMTQINSKIKNDLSEDQRYKVVELMLDVMAADKVLDAKENELIENTVRSLSLDNKIIKTMRDARLSKLTTINVADGDEEKLFGLNEKMSNQQKCKELRKQYSKWSGLTASNDKNKREQATRMVEKIAKLRQDLNC